MFVRRQAGGESEPLELLKAKKKFVTNPIAIIDQSYRVYKIIDQSYCVLKIIDQSYCVWKIIDQSYRVFTIIDQSYLLRACEYVALCNLDYVGGILCRLECLNFLFFVSCLTNNSSNISPNGDLIIFQSINHCRWWNSFLLTVVSAAQLTPPAYETLPVGLWDQWLRKDAC